MNASLVIRDETTADHDAIAAVTEAAFRTLAISQHTEQFIIAALRSAGALSVSLVAERAGQVIGHVAFSPVTISDGTTGWYGLGPLSVLPEYQRQGVGTALVHAGLARLRAGGGRGCCLVGHPDYYRRVGFTNPPTLRLDGVPPEVFLACCFAGDWPAGSVTFHSAFAATR